MTRDPPFIGSALSETNLPQPESLVMGTWRGNRWISTPKPEEGVREGDRLLIYRLVCAVKRAFNQEIRQ